MDTSHPKGPVASAFSRYMRQILKEKILTVTTNRVGLGQEETILALPCWNFSVRKLRKELWLFVVFEVGICFRKIDLETTDGSSGANLNRVQFELNLIILVFMEITHEFALWLVRDSPESSKRHL